MAPGLVGPDDAAQGGAALVQLNLPPLGVGRPLRNFRVARIEIVCWNTVVDYCGRIVWTSIEVKKSVMACPKAARMHSTP